MSLSITEALYGEVLALRVIAQHIITDAALRSNEPADTVRAAHERAQTELANIVVEGPPARVEEVRIHAGSVLDSTYAVAATAIKPPDKA